MVTFRQKSSEAGGFSSTAWVLLLLNTQNQANPVMMRRLQPLHSRVLKPHLPACRNLVQHKHIPGLQILIFSGFLLFCPSKLRWFLKSGFDYIKGGGICFFRALPNKTCTQEEWFEVLQAAFIHQKEWASLLLRSTQSLPPTLIQRRLQNSSYHSGPDVFGTQTADAHEGTDCKTSLKMQVEAKVSSTNRRQRHQDPDTDPWFDLVKNYLTGALQYLILSGILETGALHRYIPAKFTCLGFCQGETTGLPKGLQQAKNAICVF